MLLLIIGLLIITAVVLFYALEKYIVYGQDDLRLEIPFLSTSSPDEGDTKVDIGEISLEIIHSSPDYSNLETGAGEGLTERRAICVPASMISPEGIENQKNRLTTYGADTLILEMKPDSGELPYASSVALAGSYDAAGTQELTETILDLRSQGIYLVARISCFADKLMATRNGILSLKNTEGAPYHQDGKYWLDPYNTAARKYVTDIIKELSSMGFDEILLTNLSHPASADLIYSQDISSQRDSISCISAFALKLTQTAARMTIPATTSPVGGNTQIKPEEPAQPQEDEVGTIETEVPEDTGDAGTGLETPHGAPPENQAEPNGMATQRPRLSVLIDSNTLNSRTPDNLTGQNPELFFKIFDRIYAVSSALTLESDIDSAGALLTSGSVSTRFVPILSAPPENGSWAIN